MDGEYNTVAQDEVYLINGVGIFLHPEGAIATAIEMMTRRIVAARSQACIGKLKALIEQYSNRELTDLTLFQEVFALCESCGVLPVSIIAQPLMKGIVDVQELSEIINPPAIPSEE